MNNKAKLSQYGVNKSVNSTPSERNIQEQHKEILGKNVYNKNPSSFRPFSPQLKPDQPKYNSPPPSHMKSTKTQIGFNNLIGTNGVGSSNFSNANIRAQIITQKESDINFSKMVQQQYMLNQQNLQNGPSQRGIAKILQDNDKSLAYDKPTLPSITQSQSKEIKSQNPLPKLDGSMRRYDSCDRALTYLQVSKPQMSEEINAANRYGKLYKQSSQTNISAPINAPIGQAKQFIVKNQTKVPRQNLSQTSMLRIQQEYQSYQLPLTVMQQSKTTNTKRSVTHISQTDLDLAFNQMDDNIELPKSTENPHLSKLYKQKFDLQVQNQQIQKVCISSLGTDLYRKVLEKFKYHISRDEELSRQDQDQINLIIDTDLKYKKDCVNKLYQIISMESQISDIQSQIYQIELNS